MNIEKRLVPVLNLKFYAPWVHSLKEKRMIIKSLIAKVSHKFNVSVVESGEQDTHSIIIISIAGLAANSAQADSMMEHIINFLEANTEAELIEIEKELR